MHVETGARGVARGAGIGALGILALLVLPACTSPESTACGESVCPPGYKCDPVHELCVLDSQLADCVGLPDGAPCYARGQSGYVCHLQVCIPSYCGDGIVDRAAGEQCDDASDNSDEAADACRTTCQRAICGDGVVDTGEQCDDGATNSDAIVGACRTNCTLAACGNGLLEIGEECDDGAGNADDVPNACRTDCHLPRCGDGVKDYGEQCDDGNYDEQDACLNSCERNVCGDFIVNHVTEECDDGNLQSLDGCASDCRIEEVLFLTAEFYRVLPTSDGSFIVVSVATESTTNTLLAQWFDAQGQSVTPPVEVTALPSYVIDTIFDAAANEAGRLVVCFENGDLSCQRFESDGTPLGSPITVSTGTQHDVHVDMAPDGRFVVGFRQGPSPYTEVAYVYAADGSPVTGEVVLETATLYGLKDVGIAGDGRFDALIGYYNSGTSHMVLRRYSATGVQQGSDITTPNASGNAAGWLSVLADGRFVIFRSNQTSLYFHRYQADGTPVGWELYVGDSYWAVAPRPWGAVDSQGRILVTWAERYYDSSVSMAYGRILARQYDFSGIPLATWQVNTVENFGGYDVPTRPRVSMSRGGQTVIHWTGPNNTQFPVYLKRYDDQGHALGW